MMPGNPCLPGVGNLPPGKSVPRITPYCHSSSIGGFAEHQGSTKLTPRGLPINATESERKTFEAGFKAMPQGFTRTLDQLADCLAKA
jgi:hypothetical protein